MMQRCHPVPRLPRLFSTGGYLVSRKEIIRKKRDGHALSDEEIRFLSTAFATTLSPKGRLPPSRCHFLPRYDNA